MPVLYLSSAEANNKVSDESVLGLSRAVADHDTPAIALGKLATKRRKKKKSNPLLYSLLRIMAQVFWLCCDVDTHACSDSVTEPIWLTFRSRQLQDFSLTALAIRLGFVTVRSSPTTWMLVPAVNLVHASQSSWSKGSSMDTTEEIKTSEPQIPA